MSDYFGMYKGLVTDNNDPLGKGRVRAVVPKIFGESPTGWISPIVPTVIKPEISSTIYVQFVDGDTANPVYAGTQAISAGQINAGAIDAMTITGNTINGAVITGSLLQTAMSGARVVMGIPPQPVTTGEYTPIFNDIELDAITYYSGLSTETKPANVYLYQASTLPGFGEPVGQSVGLYLESPHFSGMTGGSSLLELLQYTSGQSEARLVSDLVEIQGGQVKVGTSHLHFGVLGLPPMTVDDTAGTVQIGRNSAAGVAVGGLDIQTNVLGNAHTDSLGQQTFNHGLGVVPQTVLVTPRNTFYNWFLVSATTTTFTLEWGAVSGGSQVPIVGLNPAIDFIAVG